MPTAHAWSVAGKRSVAAVILVLLPLAPSLLLAPLGLGAATGTFALGAAAGLIAGLMVDLRFGVAVAVVVGIANLVALAAAPYAILAGLVMAAVAMLYGLTARRGITAIIVVAPESVAFTLAEPPQVLANGSILVNALAVGGVALVGGLWGAGAGAILGRRLPHKKPVGVTTRRAVAFAGIIAAVTGVTMGVVVAMQLQHGGAWILLTILLVAQPGLHRAPEVQHAFLAARDLQQLRVLRGVPVPVQALLRKGVVERREVHAFRVGKGAVHIENQGLEHAGVFRKRPQHAAHGPL